MRSTSPPEAFPAHTPAASQIFTTVLSHGPLTRSEIAGRTRLSAAAVTKAVRPSEAELARNPRSRSATLRVARRTAASPWVQKGRAS